MKLYQLAIVKAIKAHGLTVIEVAAKTGISSAAIFRFDASNECYFSDLFALSQAIECPLEKLYITQDCDSVIKSKRVVRRERKTQRRADVYALLSQHFPDEISFVAQCLNYEETEAANRLWANRLSTRATANVNKKASNESYIEDLLRKISQLKQSLSLK